MLLRAAKHAARAAACWNIPIRKLTPAELKAGKAGFCGHIDQTTAWEVKGGHWDPGPNFPWKQFLGMVQEEFDKIKAAHAAAQTPKEGN